MAKRKIKLYIHHDVFQEYIADDGTHILWRIARFPWRVVYGVCYGAGFTVGAIVKAGITGVQKIGDGGIGTALLIYKPFRRVVKTVREKSLPLTQPAFKVSAVLFLICIIVTTVFLHAGSVISSGLQLQGRVLGITSSGLSQLKDAQQALENQQTVVAQTELAGALQQFQRSQDEIKSVGGLLNGVLNIIPQKRDAEAVVSAITDLTQAGLTLTQSYEALNGVSVSAEGLTTGDNKAALETFDYTVTQVIAHVDSAASKLESVSDSSIPQEQRALFMQARDTIIIARKALHNFQEVYGLFAQIINGNKELLVFFQNNNELRATGGFLGTYGILKMTDGKISNMKISSIYDLDGQLTEEITPPQALLAVNTRWYLRDANWFLDFPTSAQKMIEFYEKEGGQTPDLVLVMTPELVVQLLEKTGPITMSRYNTTLTSENFIETTQLLTSIYYDKKINQPKQMLADFFPVLLQTVSTLPLEKRLRTFEGLQQAFAEKQILLYSKSSETQQKIEQFNWGGAVTQSDRDYLAVSVSNLGGTKTDTYMQQAFNLSTGISADGHVTNTLSITRNNPLPKSDNTVNKSYVRFYVPEGAQLIEATGFSTVDIPTPTHNYKTDPDVAKIETTTIKQLGSSTYISTENGKTVFGNWMTVEGGQTQTATISYTLPFTVTELDRYSLVLQKQPGAPSTNVTHTIAYPNYTALWQTSGQESENQNHQSKRTYELRTDQFTGLVLERN